MRISDWSSDVCSSDLLLGQVGQPLPGHRRVEITAARQRKDQLFLGLGELVFELRRRIVEICLAARVEVVVVELAEGLVDLPHASANARLSCLFITTSRFGDRKSTRLNSSH